MLQFYEMVEGDNMFEIVTPPPPQAHLNIVNILVKNDMIKLHVPVNYFSSQAAHLTKAWIDVQAEPSSAYSWRWTDNGENAECLFVCLYFSHDNSQQDKE